MTILSGKLSVLPVDDVIKDSGSCCAMSVMGSSEMNPAVIADNGFAGNVAIVTLGCAKNTVDSEVMLGALSKKGFRPVSDLSAADMIVVNTCGFLQSAVEEGIDRILEASEYKRTARCKKLIVAGCMVERYRADLEKSMPEVDRFLSTDEILQIGDDIETSIDCFDSARRPYFIYDETMPRIVSTGGHSAYIKISEGCDRPCAFCIIPKIRGKFRSRSKDSIIQEARNLLASGVLELNLVAQDLTAYGDDFTDKSKGDSELVSLMKQLDLLEGDYWLRLLYAYPIGVNDALLRAIVESSHFAKYLDLPLQHISHDVLKRMRRPLGEKGTRSLIEKIKTFTPEIALRTTFILGFPGETWDDVKALGSFISEGHFSHIGVFKYSQEEEADSFHFQDQVSEKDKDERMQYVIDIQKALVERRLAAYNGKRIKVLVDGLHSETDLLYTSRAEWQAPETDGEVLINDNALLDSGVMLENTVGKFAEVEITDVADYDLIGTLVGVF